MVGISGAESGKDVRGTWEREQKQNEQERRILEGLCPTRDRPFKWNYDS